MKCATFAPSAGIVPRRVPPSLLDELPLWASAKQPDQHVEEGIQRAHDHANDKWKSAAHAAIIAVARRMRFFTSDDVWDELKGCTETTHNPSALGPLFRIVARSGLIQKSGLPDARTRYTETRHRNLTVWQSLMYEGND